MMIKSRIQALQFHNDLDMSALNLLEYLVEIINKRKLIDSIGRR